MLRLRRLTIRNFLSVGAVTQSISLDDTGLALLLGHNADKASNSRNGAGKTTMVQAISYALYGQPLSRIKLDNLTNNVNGKGMLVTLDFEVGGKSYRIERGRKPNVLKFYVNGAPKDGGEDETKGENKETQAEIERIVGMTHTMFKHIVALNTSTDAFLRLKAAEQREVIEELLGITLLSQRADAIKKLRDDTKDAIKVEEADVKAKTEANTRIETAAKRAEEEADAWEKVRERRLLELAGEIETLDGVDFDTEIALFDALDAWIAAEREHRAAEEKAKGEAAAARREAQRLDGEAIKAERETDAATQAHVTRLEAELRRLRSEASETRTPQVDRLLAEAKRLRASAAEDVGPSLVRLEAEAARKEQEGERLATEAVAVLDEIAIIETEIANPDGHHCTTCGQGLAGTDHLAKVKAALEAKAASLGAHAAKLSGDAEARLREADEIRAERETVVTEHTARCERLLTGAVKAEAEAEQAREAHAARLVEAAERMRETEAEITKLRAAMEAARDERTEVVAAIRMQAGEARALVDQHEATASACIAAIRALGPRPTPSYRNRDEVYRARQERDRLLSLIETEAEKENPHAAKAITLRATMVAVSYDTLNDLATRLKHEEFLLKLLTSKDSFVRKKIIDTNLAFLNGRINHYLDAIGLPHEVRIQPDMTVEISLLGRDFDFEQLSRGEQNRLILAVSWSFRDVWENLNRSVNLMLLDELLDFGLDDAGSESALEVMKRMGDKGRNVILISNKESLTGRFSRIVLAAKEDGFTTYREQ